MNKHRKGWRGAVKAKQYFSDRGYICEIWPHNKGNNDAFGFADIIGISSVGTMMLA